MRVPACLHGLVELLKLERTKENKRKTLQPKKTQHSNTISQKLHNTLPLCQKLKDYSVMLDLNCYSPQFQAFQKQRLFVQLQEPKLTALIRDLFLSQYNFNNR